jgi:hypothetical protein
MIGMPARRQCHPARRAAAPRSKEQRNPRCRTKAACSHRRESGSTARRTNLLPRDDLRRAAIDRCPAPTGDARADAFLGALAEHLAATAGLERPGWSVEHGRFLECFWFPSPVPGFRALAIAESPAAFRRRGIFIARGALERV